MQPQPPGTRRPTRVQSGDFLPALCLFSVGLKLRELKGSSVCVWEFFCSSITRNNIIISNSVRNTYLTNGCLKEVSTAARWLFHVSESSALCHIEACSRQRSSPFLFHSAAADRAETSYRRICCELGVGHPGKSFGTRNHLIRSCNPVETSTSCPHDGPVIVGQLTASNRDVNTFFFFLRTQTMRENSTPRQQQPFVVFLFFFFFLMG